jgi:4-hydroxybenzoyl-CoA thioesterase/acyl-CoA thioester hydrolase
MSQPFKTKRRVEFHHTDAAGIMHFAVFFNFMEEAEHEFLRHLGLSVLARDEQGTISWPRVAARCDYQSAVRFEDVLDIEIRIVRVGKKSVTYEFSFSHDAIAVATGQMTSVCCRFKPDGVPKSVDIPAWIRQKLPLQAKG